MADFKELIPFILKWEGGFVNDPLDAGGETNKGVTLTTFRQYFGKERTVNELKAISEEQWIYIFKAGFWNKWRADEIESQSVADILVDWYWMSGAWGIKIPQRLLGVVDDGVVGVKTLAALNDAKPRKLFYEIKAARIQYYDDIIAKTPTNERFRKGWMNRLNEMKYRKG